MASSTSPTSQPCLVVGNPDFYGIGVRVGLYAQWVATLLITLFSPKDEETVRIVTLIIQTALFLGICQQSNSSKATAVEPVVVMFLMVGSLSSLTGNGVSRLSHVSGIYRILFYTALSSYSIWYWFVGVDARLKSGCDEIAFFGHASIDGWFRQLAKTLSVLGLALSTVLMGMSMNAIKLRLQKPIRGDDARMKRQRPQVEIGLAAFSMGLIAFSISIIEYLLQVNKVTRLSNIYSVGQLIPLLIGTLECFLVAWKILTHGLMFQKRCWFLLGKHL